MALNAEVSKLFFCTYQLSNLPSTTAKDAVEVHNFASLKNSYNPYLPPLKAEMIVAMSTGENRFREFVEVFNRALDILAADV